MIGLSLSSMVYPRRVVMSSPKQSVSSSVSERTASSECFRFSEKSHDIACISALKITNRLVPLMAVAFEKTARLIDKAPRRFKPLALLGYAVAEESRLQHTQSINKQYVEKHLDRELKKIPEGWVGIGLHGSRQRAPLILKPREHLYIEVLRPENSIEKKVAQAQYCTFYTQGVGRLYILACRKEEESSIRKEIRFCVENYISPSDVKDPKTGEDRFKLIDITAVQSFQSPYTAFRSVWQTTATMMFEGEVTI